MPKEGSDYVDTRSASCVSPPEIPSTHPRQEGLALARAEFEDAGFGHFALTAQEGRMRTRIKPAPGRRIVYLVLTGSES